MQHDHELHDLVQEAVDAGLIDVKSPWYAIAQQFIHQGYASLSDNQKFAFYKFVAPQLEKLANSGRFSHASTACPTNDRNSS